MIKRILFISILALFASCQSGNTERTMVVEGQVRGLKKGTIYLQRVKDSALVNLDSLKVEGDGKFSFNTAIENPEIYYLYLDKDDGNVMNDRITFFGETGLININTAWNAFEKDADIKGSAIHDKWMEYKEVATQFDTREIEILQNSFAEDTRQDSLAMDSLQELLDKNFLRRYLYTINFALNNRNSHLAPYLAVHEASDARIHYLDSIYKVLPDSVASGTYGKALKKMLDSRKASGE